MAVEKSPVAWAITPFKKYAQFSGRAPRAELWWFMLFMFIASIALWFLLVGSMGGLMSAGTDPSAGMLQALGGGVILIAVCTLAIVIPSIAVQVRRLHDTNRSGWWLGGYYLLYAVYMALAFSSFMSAAVDPNAAPDPNVGMLGMTMILGLALFVYLIVLLVFYVLPGTSGPNNYGPDPYGAQENLEGVFS
jgi:uncharacterized membrane protein YhaH (DUF805 family)